VSVDIPIISIEESNKTNDGLPVIDFDNILEIRYVTLTGYHLGLQKSHASSLYYLYNESGIVVSTWY
jgi:hypothetical protein